MELNKILNWTALEQYWAEQIELENTLRQKSEVISYDYNYY